MTRQLRKLGPEQAEGGGEQRPDETRAEVDAPAAPVGPEAAEPAVTTGPGAETAADLDARVDKLLDAANAASTHVRNLYLFFLSFGLYLAIIFGSTTHGQLLRASPVTLPLLNVGLPLLGFYFVAPALFVLLHLNLLLQLMMLAGTLHRLKAVDQIGDEERQKDERSRLFPFPFTQMLAGWPGHGLSHRLVTFIVWTTVVVLPVLVLLLGQLRFLPYHSWETTCWHRFLLLVDLAALWLLWSRTVDPSGQVARQLPATKAEMRSGSSILMLGWQWPEEPFADAVASTPASGVCVGSR